MNDQLTPSMTSFADQPKQSLEGAFVDGAFTLEQVEAANAEEERLGVERGQCAFLTLPSSD